MSPVPESALSDHDLDDVVEGLAQRASQWAATSARERRRLVERALGDLHREAPAGSEDACRAKGLARGAAEEAEELLAGVTMLARLLEEYRRALLDIERVGRPRYAGPVRQREGGRLSVQVTPGRFLDRILFTRDRAEVWMAPGVDEARLRARQAWAYRDPRPAGLALVLGAGNVASLAPKDALHQLLVEGRVVIVKASPVNDYLVDHWRAALAGFIDAGVLAVVSGGAAVGERLTHHPRVDTVHLTGSSATYNAVVFGVGEEGADRRRRGEPRLTTPVTAELGDVAPLIIVPGTWSPREMRYQAAHVATMLVNNAGFNCLTPRVLVTSRAWAQREEFFATLEAVLAGVAPRRAYYPGAIERYRRLSSVHPEARRVGSEGPSTLPWTIARDLDASRRDDPCFTDEAFCAFVGEAPLDAGGPAEFLEAAVDFCHDTLVGSLSATVLIDPRTARDPRVARELERSIARLRYGTIGLNVFHALGIVVGATPWGAHPGHTREDIGSGVGSVDNALMFADAQKSVVTGPFTTWPTPAWFITHSHACPAMWRFLDLTCTRRWRYLPGLLWFALRA